MTVRREYGFALLAGAAGAVLVLLAVRQRWAQAVFTPPKPLSPQVVSVSGSDLVPLAGALALAALAGLAGFVYMRVTAPAFFRRETLTRTSPVLVFNQEL